MEWNASATIHLGGFSGSRRLVEAVGARVIRLVERCYYGKKPPLNPIGFFVAEPSPSGDGFHLHGCFRIVGARQQRLWTDTVFPKCVKGTLALLRKENGGQQLPSHRCYTKTWRGAEMILKAGNDLHAPNFHTSPLTVVGLDKWRNYIQKERRSDPCGDRFIVGHSFGRGLRR